MRDFQGQLCFTNSVIMPLKILIVLAMFNRDQQQSEVFSGEWTFLRKQLCTEAGVQSSDWGLGFSVVWVCLFWKSMPFPNYFWKTDAMFEELWFKSPFLYVLNTDKSIALKKKKICFTSFQKKHLRLVLTGPWAAQMMSVDFPVPIPRVLWRSGYESISIFLAKKHASGP